MNCLLIALRHCLVSCVLLFAVTGQAGAITINSTESRYESGGIRYYFTVDNWSIYDTTPSPCRSDNYGVDTCVVELAMRPNPANASTIGERYEWRVPVGRGKATMGDMLTTLNRYGFSIPFRGSVLVSKQSNVNSEMCLSFSVSTIGPAIGGVIGLFGPCTRVMPPILRCDISGDTTIDHKSLADTQLDGATASIQLTVHCKGTTSVTITTSISNYFGVKLRSDGSLYSRITVNGRDATYGTYQTVRDDEPTPVNITSTLITHGTVAPGSFSGSTVITISPP